MTARRVFIINDSGHNFSQALSYGTPVFVTQDRVPKFNLTEMLRTFKEAFSTSTPDDYILITGPLVMNVVAGAYFAHKHGHLNLLLYHADREGNDRYISRKIVFSNGDTHVEKVESDD